jgi:hypothetical protein
MIGSRKPENSFCWKAKIRTVCKIMLRIRKKKFTSCVHFHFNFPYYYQFPFHLSSFMAWLAHPPSTQPAPQTTKPKKTPCYATFYFSIIHFLLCWNYFYFPFPRIDSKGSKNGKINPCSCSTFLYSNINIGKNIAYIYAVFSTMP